MHVSEIMRQCSLGMLLLVVATDPSGSMQFQTNLHKENNIYLDMCPGAHQTQSTIQQRHKPCTSTWQPLLQTGLYEPKKKKRGEERNSNLHTGICYEMGCQILDQIIIILRCTHLEKLIKYNECIGISSCTMTKTTPLAK